MSYKNNRGPKKCGTLIALKSKRRTTTPDEKEIVMKTNKRMKRDQGKKAGVQICIWSEAGVVSSRSCTRRLECERCLFDQNMMDFFTCKVTPLPAVPKAA